MKFSRTKYIIRNHNGDWEQQVSGWQYGTTGLAARASDKNGYWFIDHIPTGHRVCQYWPSRDAAYNAIERLTKEHDWRAPLEEIVNNEFYTTVVRPVKVKLGGPLT